MKRISLLAMAVALVMTLTQCKKTETPTNENEGGKVHITLDVSSGAKVIISPETGGTAFEQGDKVLVANGGHYVGTLTYNKNLRKFDGDLDAGLDEGDYLHFYLLGNKDTEENLDDTENRPTTLTVNISDQTAAYPEIAYAHSTDTYTEGVTAYKARLLNKCALVKFTTNSIRTTVAVTITGMNNKVAVNLGDNSFTYSKVDGGAIALHAESRTERWGILLPQGEVTDATSSANGFAMTEAFTVPEIFENGYLDEGIAVNLVATNPIGSINGKFTVAAGKQVYFSQGNMQYFCSTSAPEWRFAEHQYDYVAFDGSAYSENSNKWIDLFGYGTSGYNNGQTYWQPYSNYNGGGYYSGNLTGNADWGYNAISNGGNETGMWRTLTMMEWRYLFQTRSNASSKYGSSSVNGINGLVILPDIWTLPDGLSFTPGIGNWHNSYTIEQWNQMESAGAIFLPAAGSRNGTYLGTSNQTNGFYRSSTQDGAYVMFESSRLQLNAAYVQYGDCVRLVCDVENE